jgi:hypothetical protein
MPRPAEWCEHECAQLRAENTQFREQVVALLEGAQEDESVIARLQVELAQIRTGTAKVVHALDAAVQTVDALIAWMPEGLNLSPEVSGCKERLDMAMRAVMGKRE